MGLIVVGAMILFAAGFSLYNLHVKKDVFMASVFGFVALTLLIRLIGYFQSVMAQESGRTAQTAHEMDEDESEEYDSVDSDDYSPNRVNPGTGAPFIGNSGIDAMGYGPGEKP